MVAHRPVFIQIPGFSQNTQISLIFRIGHSDHKNLDFRLLLPTDSTPYGRSPLNWQEGVLVCPESGQDRYEIKESIQRLDKIAGLVILNPGSWPPLVTPGSIP
jgi:hypothetical protein